MESKYEDLVEGYQPLSRGYQPDAGHQPIRMGEAPQPSTQNRGTPPTGGSAVSPPPNGRNNKYL